MKLPGIRAREAPNSGRLGESSRSLMKERATACLQAVLLLLGKSTACKQAEWHRLWTTWLFFNGLPVACLQAVLLLLGKSTACKQAVAHIVDDLAVFQRVASLWQRIC